MSRFRDRVANVWQRLEAANEISRALREHGRPSARSLKALGIEGAFAGRDKL